MIREGWRDERAGWRAAAVVAKAVGDHVDWIERVADLSACTEGFNLSIGLDFAAELARPLRSKLDGTRKGFAREIETILAEMVYRSCGLSNLSTRQWVETRDPSGTFLVSPSFLRSDVIWEHDLVADVGGDISMGGQPFREIGGWEGKKAIHLPRRLPTSFDFSFDGRDCTMEIAVRFDPSVGYTIGEAP